MIYFVGYKIAYRNSSNYLEQHHLKNDLLFGIYLFPQAMERNEPTRLCSRYVCEFEHVGSF